MTAGAGSIRTMSTVGAILLFAAGLALVVAGAELLLDGILGAATRLRISPFALTVVLSGFELENLAAGIAANAKGLPGAAAGTFLGGTTFLAAGVAGVGALIAPMNARLPSAVLGWTAASPLPLALLSLDRELSRLDGALLLAWFCVALVGLARAGRGLLGEPSTGRRRRPLLRLLAGLTLLAGGGEVLGEGIRKTVSRLGVSETLLGNTVVAASVEAEEVARVVAPSRRGRAELGLGNVAGTIVHFVALNAGVIALVEPISLDDPTLELHLPAAIAATLLFCTLAAVRRGVDRAAGALLLVLYSGYLAAAIAVG
jgi:cation:H+ antiporter